MLSFLLLCPDFSNDVVAYKMQVDLCLWDACPVRRWLRQFCWSLPLPKLQFPLFFCNNYDHWQQVCSLKSLSTWLHNRHCPFFSSLPYSVAVIANCILISCCLSLSFLCVSLLIVSCYSCFPASSLCVRQIFLLLLRGFVTILFQHFEGQKLVVVWTIPSICFFPPTSVFFDPLPPIFFWSRHSHYASSTKKIQNVEETKRNTSSTHWKYATVFQCSGIS